ncbi:MAG: hypothetical protein M9944_07815 [Rhizobiaceae bacterium]|nr:hypothetical protein [Rhizobiaceae bacterium]
MKYKPRETWATRKLPPLTLAEIERHLDMLARLMVDAGPRAYLYLPVYRRVLKEQEKQQDAEALIAGAHARVRRLSGQTEARSF